MILKLTTIIFIAPTIIIQWFIFGCFDFIAFNFDLIDVNVKLIKIVITSIIILQV